MTRITTITEHTVEECIGSITHNIFDKGMHIVVCGVREAEITNPNTGDVTTVIEVDSSKSSEDIRVSLHNYTALMSGHPSWNPLKLEGYYSEQDIWTVVDAQREGAELSVGSVTT